MKKRKDSTVICKQCSTLLGTVFAVEDVSRIGFWSHYTVPDTIPKKCPTCKSSPERVPHLDDSYI